MDVGWQLNWFSWGFGFVSGAASALALLVFSAVAASRRKTPVVGRPFKDEGKFTGDSCGQRYVDGFYVGPADKPYRAAGG